MENQPNMFVLSFRKYTESKTQAEASDEPTFYVGGGEEPIPSDVETLFADINENITDYLEQLYEAYQNGGVTNDQYIYELDNLSKDKEYIYFPYQFFPTVKACMTIQARLINNEFQLDDRVRRLLIAALETQKWIMGEYQAAQEATQPF